MTPEELADARAKSKKRREARKLAAAEKRGYEKGVRDHMSDDSKPAPYNGPVVKLGKSKEEPKYRLGSWEDFRTNRNDPDFLKYLDRAKSIDPFLADKFVDVVFTSWRKNVPLTDIRKILKGCYIADLSSDERREYGY